MSVTLIAAIGRRGQLGNHDGTLPWGDAFGADRKRFREVTTGGVVIVGHNTFSSVAHLQGTFDRRFVQDSLWFTPRDILPNLSVSGRRLFVAGGAKTFRRWLPVITEFDVTLLPYDGPADVSADFLLPHVTREFVA